ncbi:hypothetical protein LWI29_003954 [Acer saccharum]|uniref:Apple domain-containing protein n=1 Tax=Acer saccharum TaxID=4024 RepID=A0AA39SU95_ACESA|nr:hypothetical protein LWI29_003954 [Acer saccharum]
MVSELLAEEIRFKSQTGKGTLSTPNPSVLVVPSRPPSNYQNKSYSRVAIDECSFCKQKGHWKAQCPKILNKASQRKQQQPLPWKFGNQSQQQTYMPPQPNTATTVPSGSFGFDGPSSSNPSMSALAEQFQKFLAIQPQAMFTSSPIGLLSPSSSGMFSSTWVLDSGASHHMSPNLSYFVSLCPTSSLSVMTADGTPMPLAGVGSVVTPCVSLSNVYHIPNLTLNLVSVSQLCDFGYLVYFSSTSCHVQDPQSQKLIGTGRRQGELYFLDELRVPVVAAFGVDLSSFRLSYSSSSFYLWHSRLGHVSASRLKYLASTGALGNLQTHDISDCSGYSLSSSVPCTKDTNSPSIPITHFPLHYFCRSCTDTSANTGTSLSDASDAPPLPIATQAPTETVDPPRYPQRDRSWNGLRWTGTPYLGTNSVYTYEFVSNETGLFYTFDIRNISVPERWVMSSSGYLLPSKWKDQNWERFSVTEVDRCELYDVCGSYASCNINNLPDLCECLEGFTPKSPGQGTEGCVRRAPLHCNHSDRFLLHKEVKLPDTSHSRVDNNISLAECKEFCLNNCSCTAYANSDVREGRTCCLLWFGDLFDIKKLELNGQDLYVRVAVSELANIDQPIARRRHLSEKKRAIILVSCVVSAVGVLVLGWVIFMGKRKLRIQDNIRDVNNSEVSKTDDTELLMYDLNTIANATDNFADENKLGEGGF